MRAVDELWQDGHDISLKIIENASHEAVLHAMQEADVVIDQLILGWYGMVTVEAWALHKPVVCYIRPDLYEKYAPPVCPADPAIVEDAIRELYKFPSARKMWADRGYEYARRVHDIRNMNF